MQHDICKLDSTYYMTQPLLIELEKVQENLNLNNGRLIHLCLYGQLRDDIVVTCKTDKHIVICSKELIEISYKPLIIQLKDATMNTICKFVMKKMGIEKYDLHYKELEDILKHTFIRSGGRY
ncbi:MAG: hypothetical protein JXQ67_05895 [Campylobacterales bacterium]|nr:hypothetical protein [Campylobacterales bacterium]